MTSRTRRLDRIVSLVKLQLRLSQWQLAQLRKREQDLQDEEVYLIGALNGATPTGSSIESVSQRLNATSTRSRATEIEVEKQSDRVRVQGVRVRKLESVASAALIVARRDAEKRVLEDGELVSPRKHAWAHDGAKR